MAKSAGLGDNFYVAGVDLSGDVGSLSRIGGGNSPLDVTSINKSGMERIGGVRSGEISFTTFFNKATSQEHLTLAPLPTSDVIMTYCRGTALGAQSANLVGKQVNYDPTRGVDGSLTIGVQALSNSFGIEWGELLTAGKRTDTSATNGSSLDNGASTAFGLQAYLHVFAFTGTSVTVKIQESSDNAVGDPFADVVGGSFTAATGVTSQRIATASGLTVERYLRVVTTGTFSNAVFAVSMVRNATAVSF